MEYDYCSNCEKSIDQIDLGDGSFGCPHCKRDDCIEIRFNAKEVKLGKCPYCNSINYSREDTNLEEDFFRVRCSCNDCDKEFTEFFRLDEVKFDLDDDSVILNNVFSEKEKETLIKALNLLIEKEGDVKDYTRIFNILNGGLNEE